MAFSWNFSFLVDRSGRILDVQGNCLQAFGATGQELIGRSLLPHIAPGERIHFRRFLAQLDAPSAIRQSLLHLRSGTHADHLCLLQAAPGPESGTFRIELTEKTDGADAHSLADLPVPVPEVDVTELQQLIEMAISDLPPDEVPVLDLTVMEIGCLIDPSAIAADDPALPERLRQRIEQTLMADAFDDVVCRADDGSYVLLHEEKRAVGEIAAGIGRAAQELGIGANVLNLKQRSVKLGRRPGRTHLRTMVEEALLLRAAAGRTITTPTRRYAPLLWGGAAAGLVILVAVGLMFMA